MRNFFAKHLAVIPTGTAFNLPFLWKGAVWLTDWLARFDFWTTHGPEMRPMIGYITDPPPWMVFVTSAIGVGIVLWDVNYPNTLRNLKSTLLANKTRMALYLGLSIVCFLLGSGFAAAAYWQYKYPPSPPPPEESALLKAAHDEFQHTGGVAEETEIFDTPPGTAFPPVAVKIWVRSDLISMAKFLVFYIPRGIDTPNSPPLAGAPFRPLRQTYDSVRWMADRFSEMIRRVDAKSSAGVGDIGADNMRYSTEAPFTGAIYIYHEGDLTEAERVELRALYQSRGARAFFRSWRYLKESRSLGGH
jgi:hypothetical protein